MSCIAIDLQSIVNVRDALKRMDIVNKIGYPFPNWFDYDEFFYNVFVFNTVEYFEGKFAEKEKENEPKDWLIVKDELKRRKGKEITQEQLYKSLCFMSYNTSARGWLSDETYNNWCRKEDYEFHKKIMRRMIELVAFVIIEKLDNYKKAEWK